jgi:hypothetical protein
LTQGLIAFFTSGVFCYEQDQNGLKWQGSILPHCIIIIELENNKKNYYAVMSTDSFLRQQKAVSGIALRG